MKSACTDFIHRFKIIVHEIIDIRLPGETTIGVLFSLVLGFWFFFWFDFRFDGSGGSPVSSYRVRTAFAATRDVSGSTPNAFINYININFLPLGGGTHTDLIVSTVPSIFSLILELVKWVFRILSSIFTCRPAWLTKPVGHWSKKHHNNLLKSFFWTCGQKK